MPDPENRFYESQGLQLHYADWGNENAPPLILVHGGRDHCRSWDLNRSIVAAGIFMSWRPTCADTAIPTGPKAAATP